MVYTRTLFERGFAMHIIRSEYLSKTYLTNRKNGFEVNVLKGIKLEIEKGDYIGIMGKSGSGKTTLLNIIGSLDTPTSGNIYYYTDNYSNMNFSQVEDFRRKKVGYIFQDFRLVDTLTLKDNIILPMLFDGKAVEECDKRVMELTEKFDIQKLLSKYPYEISGGEKQRTAICRAMANDPEVILADEPTGNLDSQAATKVVEEIDKINNELGKTVILVTHDPEIASHCKKIFFLKDGQIFDVMDEIEDRKLFYNKILKQMYEL